jgi:hypothetical protein
MNAFTNCRFKFEKRVGTKGEREGRPGSIADEDVGDPEVNHPPQQT